MTSFFIFLGQMGAWVIETGNLAPVLYISSSTNTQLILKTSLSTSILNTPSMSYTAPSASSFQSTERTSQCTINSEFQQQRYVSLSSYACQRVTKHDPRATVYIQRRSTYSTTIHFSTSFISTGHSFWVKTKMSISVWMVEDDGLGNGGGIDSPRFAKDGGLSSLGQHPTWASASFVHMARLLQICWHTHHPSHSSSTT